MSKLVIVESPAKAKTIQKYLGPGYEVMASMGHVRDLPKSKLGIDVEHDFRPQYVNIEGKTQLIHDLQNVAAKSDFVYLATDPDREGEAISWHLAQLLALNMDEANRVTFNEITKTGIQEGMSKPRSLDLDFVDAQQARRVLDRIVGYKISPFLWKKVRRGLSAGRVQSVAVKIIVDREREIRAFVPEEYWSLDAVLKVGKPAVTFKARFYGTPEAKLDVVTEEQALAKAAALCSGAEKCTSQIREKLSAWGMDEEKSERIITYLKQEKYIDERRYCRAYSNDKMRYNHWGRIKIRQALRMQALAQEDIEQGLEALDQNEYEKILKETIDRKAKTLRETDGYTLKQKLLRHAYSHGFEPELIFRLVDIAEE